MSNAFNDFLSSVASGASGDGGPNMKSYQHATKLYVDGGYARAPKFNHLYFVGFNINDGVVRDRSWLQSGVNEVGLLVKSASLPKFKISTEQMNQYNRKTQVQTKLNYEAVSMEFHDDNSQITNGLWKNYYRYYYTDSIYGGKDDTVAPTPSQVSLGKKLFGGLLSPGRKRIKSPDPSTVPEAYTNNKYKLTTYPYGLDNLQSIPFFKSIDIFVLHQQKFTQYTLVNPKIVSWDHDDVAQSESTKLMRNKMSVVYENVLYNNGSIGKGSRSGIFAEAFYDSSPSPLSIAGKGSLSLFGSGGIIGGIEDVFGENGSLAQGNYLAAALQAATLIKNAGQITEQQLSAEGYSMLGAAVGVAVSSKNGEIIQNLQNNFGNSIGVYTNQFTKNNLEDIPTAPVQLVNVEANVESVKSVRSTELAQQTADRAARARDEETEVLQQNARLIQTEVNKVDTQIEEVNKIRVETDEAFLNSIATITQFSPAIISETQANDPTYLETTTAYITSLSAGLSEEAALTAASQSIKESNATNQIIINQAIRARDSASAYAKVLDAQIDGLAAAKNNIQNNSIILDGAVQVDNSTVYTAYQIAAKTYSDAIASDTITSVGRSQLALQTKINQVVGAAIQDNVQLKISQNQLGKESSAAADIVASAVAEETAWRNNYLNLVGGGASVAAVLADINKYVDLSNDPRSAWNEYLLQQYSKDYPDSEVARLKNSLFLSRSQLTITYQNIIDTYGPTEGAEKFATARYIAAKDSDIKFDKLSEKTEIAKQINNDINKRIVENSIKILDNDAIVNKTVIYGTNSVESGKLLDKMIKGNSTVGADGFLVNEKPFIILTDSRTLSQAVADVSPPTRPTATTVSSSPDWQMAVDIAHLDLRKKLAVELYGDAGRANEIELTDINQPVTQTTNAKGTVIYTATVSASTPVASRALTTDVTITTRGAGGEIRTETISFSQANGNYLSPADAAGQVYKNYSTGTLKILGIVANTSNKVIKRY